MKKTMTAAFLTAAFLASSAFAQDWYHDREGRFHGDQWRGHVFTEVRNDLEHIWSANRAADRERRRLDRTKQELTELQAKLDRGRFDNGILNDVIDSIRKSSNDDRLAPRDREVLTDDLNRLKDYQVNHNHWNR
jgi:hypothetical protein